MTSTMAIAAPPTATASMPDCSGLYLQGTPYLVINNHEHVVAELEVFYQPQDGGTNVACLRHVGATEGVRSITSIWIFRCDSEYWCTRETGEVGAHSNDLGNYISYAGPVWFPETNNKCVAVYGYIENPDVPGSVVHVYGDNLGCRGEPRFEVYS